MESKIVPVTSKEGYREFMERPERYTGYVCVAPGEELSPEQATKYPWEVIHLVQVETVLRETEKVVHVLVTGTDKLVHVTKKMVRYLSWNYPTYRAKVPGDDVCDTCGAYLKPGDRDGYACPYCGRS